jgi:hypothetical protein
MNFPLVLLNVFSIFAIVGILACWLSSLVAMHHRKMRAAVRVPLIAGIAAAAKHGFSDASPSPTGIVLVFAACFLAVSIAVAYVYGWAKREEFDGDETQEGSGRFAPVMIVWTGCIAYVALVALVNLATTGTASPIHVAGY